MELKAYDRYAKQAQRTITEDTSECQMQNTNTQPAPKAQSKADENIQKPQDGSKWPPAPSFEK